MKCPVVIFLSTIPITEGRLNPRGAGSARRWVQKDFKQRSCAKPTPPRSSSCQARRTALGWFIAPSKAIADALGPRATRCSPRSPEFFWKFVSLTACPFSSPTRAGGPWLLSTPDGGGRSMESFKNPLARWSGLSAAVLKTFWPPSGPRFELVAMMSARRWSKRSGSDSPTPRNFFAQWLKRPVQNPPAALFSFRTGLRRGTSRQRASTSYRSRWTSLLRRESFQSIFMRRISAPPAAPTSFFPIEKKEELQGAWRG